MLNYQNENRDEPRLGHLEFKALFDATNQAMFIEDRDGYVISLNEAASKLWGASISELVGKHASEVLPPKLGTSSVGIVRRSHYTRPDGDTIDVEVLSTPLNLGDDEAFLTTVWPVDQTPAEGSLSVVVPAPQADEAPQRQQQQKMESLERLSERVSHDFNNILTSIVGFGSLVQTDPSLTETSRGYVDQILESAQRAEKLTGELLAFGRCPDAPSHSFEPAAAIEKADPHLREILGETITLTTICEDAVSPIAGCEDTLGEILLQLAANTREAMEGAAEGAMKIELASNDSGATVLSVSDDGPGMDEEAAAAAFEPFFTSRNDDKNRGLGLTRVYSAARNIGGTVTLDSDHGKGVHFTFTFPAANPPEPSPLILEPHNGTSSLAPMNPIAPAEPEPSEPEISEPEQLQLDLSLPEQSQPEQAEPEQAEAEQSEPEPATPPAPVKKRGSLPGGDETILVVEDEPMVREIVVRSLEHLGYTVHKASDGQEGLDRSRELADEVDLIFSDIVMPNLSGPEMIQKVREENRSTPVLFTTGFTESKHLLENGGDLREGIDLLQKPYTPNVLAERVRQKLDSLIS